MKTFKLPTKLTIEDLAKLLGLTEWEMLDELNIDCFGEGLDWSEEHEEESLKIEAERRDEMYRSWHDAVEAVAERLFGEHGLELVPVKFKRKVPPNTRPWEYRVVPKTTWEDAAEQIRQTVNGAGPFYFSSLKEFLDSGPYTYRQAALTHIGWIKDYPAVYGDRSAQMQYDSLMR
jgi:hypothetical protein